MINTMYLRLFDFPFSPCSSQTPHCIVMNVRQPISFPIMCHIVFLSSSFTKYTKTFFFTSNDVWTTSAICCPKPPFLPPVML